MMITAFTSTDCPDVREADTAVIVPREQGV